MKNMILNHEKLIDAVNVYEDNSDYTNVYWDELIDPDFTDFIGGKKPVIYRGQITMDIANEAFIIIRFNENKTVSFFVSGRDTVLGGTVVATIINNATRG